MQFSRQLIFVISAITTVSTQFAKGETLRDRALSESKSSAVKAQKSATDAQTTGFLKLKDPRPEVITRTWKYSVGFTGENFQPQGLATTTSSGSFDLSKNGQTFMPGITVGIESANLTYHSFIFSAGLRADAKFSSQSSEAVLDSGYTINDARLNTTLLSFGPSINFSHESINWVSLSFSPQFGSLNYTQTSSNDYAHFSKTAGYIALNYAVNFHVNKKWSIFTEWSQRELRDDSQIALQKDNFELGTKVTW